MNEVAERNKRVAMFGLYRRWMKAFKPGDAIRHKDFPKKTGLILTRVKSSYFYYVRFGGYTWSIPASSLYKVDKAEMVTNTVEMKVKHERKRGAP